MNLLEELTERLATQRVVVIAGAGVSIAATGDQKAASWQGLLDTGIDRCVEVAAQPARWARRMREDLSTNDVASCLSVATQVHERLRGVAEGEFRRWLEDTIGQLEVTDAAVIEALRDLRVPIATTNYDNLLEEVTGWPPVTWCDPPRVQRVLRGDEQAVIHLHGHYREPGSVVLDYRGYAEVLGDRAAQALQQALRCTYSLLYVGFGASFQDPSFSRWLAWAGETFQGRETYRHYRLCLEEERRTVEGVGDERILGVPYGERYEDLAPFLRRLAPPEREAGSEREAEPESAKSAGQPPTDRLPGREQEERSDHQGVRARYEEALPLYRRAGDVLGEADCIRSLGDIALERSDHEGALAHYAQALQLYRRVGDVLGEANCLRSLGDIAREMGDPTDAIECWHQALELYRRIPEPYAIGRTHQRLAKAAFEDDERRRHADGARRAWRSIDRLDLIERLDEELGTDFR